MRGEWNIKNKRKRMRGRQWKEGNERKKRRGKEDKMGQR